MSFGEKMKGVDCNKKGHWIAFFICLGVSLFLMIGAAIVPPPFVIDQSIFKAVGWLFGFAALSQVPALVESGKSATLKHGNTSLTVGDKPSDDDQGDMVEEDDPSA